ncbi:MAG: lipopolysaccharide biosynthesis protein [Acidobacteria bacterium]|nr:lipopolysaccharide biosynthesis protein [Acidobacteriota bacterium]
MLTRPVQMLRGLLGFLHRTDGSLQRRALRSGMWVALSSVGVAVLTFVRGIVLARLLSPEIFGLMAVSLMATRLIEIFTETGFGQALVHRQEGFEDAKDTAFAMAVARGFSLALLSLIIAPAVAWFYNQPELRGVVSLVGLSFILLGFQNINTVALQKDLDFRRLTYMELTSSVLGFVSAVALAYWLRSIWALVLGQLAAAAITSVLSFVMVPGRVKFRFDFAIARELYHYGRFITGLAIVVFFSRELDSAVIGKLLGMEQLGFYVVAYSLANIPSTYLSKMVARVMFPYFSRLQNDPEALRREYARGVRLVTTLAVPVSVAMLVLAPDIIRALYGNRWSSAAAPLQVLAIFGCFRSLWMLNGYLYNAIGRPQIDFYTSLARLMAMTVLLFPLASAYGVVGAALAVTLPMVAQFALGVHLSGRFIGAPASTAIGPLVVTAGQGLVLAAALVVTKLVLTAEPRVALVCLVGVCGVVWIGFNGRQIRSLLAAGGSP